ncbi:MAG TPA: gluconokinase [Opitutus sp.]|nr:gluconokinase [Opitutus sp.]
MVILITGVAGSGKTTVGRQLAAALDWSFADADDFHSAANIAKMSAGHPLTDADRAPWLAALRAFIDERLARGENAVLACSALKSSYRDELVAGRGQIRLVYLRGSRALLLDRLRHRTGHYMKPAMLDSQLAALEPPADALALDIRHPPAALVEEIRRTFRV